MSALLAFALISLGVAIGVIGVVGGCAVLLSDKLDKGD